VNPTNPPYQPVEFTGTINYDYEITKKTAVEVKIVS
jgi:hypothetical protein